jgi:tetratricopeptide (TPR) repeat protein
MSQGSKALERGQVPQAQASFKRASALKPQDPNPIAQLGWCELAARNPRGALAYFKRALSVKSDYGDALYGLGYAQERMRKWAEARAHFERYLKLYPSGAKVRIIQNKLNKMPK